MYIDQWRVHRIARFPYSGPLWGEIHQLSVDTHQKHPEICCFDVLFLANLASCWTNTRVAGDLRDAMHSCDVDVMRYTGGVGQ